MAPIHLERLIEICCSLAIESCPHVMRQTGSCTPLQDLEKWGLIELYPTCEKTEHGWKPTDKGKVHVDAVCGLDFPTQQWISRAAQAAHKVLHMGGNSKRDHIEHDRALTQRTRNE